MLNRSKRERRKKEWKDVPIQAIGSTLCLLACVYQSFYPSIWMYSIPYYVHSHSHSIPWVRIFQLYLHHSVNISPTKLSIYLFSAPIASLIHGYPVASLNHLEMKSSSISPLCWPLSFSLNFDLANILEIFTVYGQLFFSSVVCSSFFISLQAFFTPFRVTLCVFFRVYFHTYFYSVESIYM